MQDFRNLMVWTRSHELVREVYRISRDFPREELFGLTSQLRRCAVSIPSNLPKVVDEVVIPILRGFSSSPWDRAARSSINYFSPGISATWIRPCTKHLKTG